MRFLSVAILASVLFAGCSKVYNNKIEGRYTGTFHRYIDPLSNPAASNVTLHFSDDEFSGTSSMMYYPAIGDGTYSATAEKLNIKNEGFFTANFDWTFIFNGEYKYELSGDQLKIWKDYPQGKRDIYLLKKDK